MGNLDWISLLLFLWSILLHRTSAAPSTTPSFIFDVKTCGVNAQTQGMGWVADVAKMASNAWTFMDSTESNTAQPWDRYRTMGAYNALFDDSHQDGTNRWNLVKNSMATMKDISTTPLRVWVACDDAPYFGTNSAGAIVFNNPIPNTPQQVPTPSAWTLCATPVTMPNGQQQYKYGYHFKYGGFSFIMLCSKQSPAVNILSSLPSAQAGDWLFTRGTWSTRLFHELTHAALPNTLAGPLVEQYGWNDAMSIRSTTGPTNSDSLMLFAQVLTMKAFLWDSGQATTFADRWTYLNAPTTIGGKQTVQRFGLYNPVFGGTTPPPDSPSS